MCTLWDKAERKETTVNCQFQRLIKLTMQNIRLKDKVSRIGIKKIKFDIGSKFNHFKDDSLSSDLYFFSESQN